jgi:hypothetical protein
MSDLSHSGVATDSSETFKAYVHDPSLVFKADTPQKRLHFEATSSASSSPSYQKDPMDFAQLQAALAVALRAKDEAIQVRDEAIQDRDQLKSHLNAITMNTSTTKTPTCLFLERIPREIRDIIYSYLLVNSELSHAECLSPIDPNSFQEADKNQQNYGLSPAILRASQQIYEEASTILYGLNTFIIDCGYGPWFRSPLARRFDEEFNPLFTTQVQLPPTVDTVPTIKKVKHWKVLLCAVKSPDNSPSEAFFNFCQAISDAPVQALKLYLIPKYDDSQSKHGLGLSHQTISQNRMGFTAFANAPKYPRF